MKIYTSFDELYRDLRGKLPTISHPVVEETKAEETKADYSAMTKAELLAVAEDKGVKVAKKATKADIIKAIEGAE